MEKVFYSTQTKVPVGILDRKHSLSSCRNNIKAYFILLTDMSGNYTILRANLVTRATNTTNKTVRRLVY